MSDEDVNDNAPPEPEYSPPARPDPSRAARGRPQFQEVPVRAPQAEGRKAPGWLTSWFRDRDVALLVLLAVLNVGSAYTTIIGARQILPAGMSDVLGAAVQTMLFLMLAGFAVNRSVVRRWMAIGLFAFASVYTSFFTYYEQLAKEADLRVQLDTALQQHATLVSAVYQPARSRADQLNHEAEAMIDLADREANRGSTTGVKGYGPVARQYAEKGNQMLVQAQRLQADVERLEPHFEFEIEGTTPEEVYRRDLEAWQLAPAEWKAEVPAPSRDDYVDMAAQVALLTPYNRVKSGEMPALTALALALMVDGIAIFLGTAIQVRRRRSVESRSHEAAMMIRAAQRSARNLWGAVRGRDPEPAPEEPDEEAARQAALDLVHVPIKGSGSEFLTTFYEAIHPQTMVLAFHELQKSANPTYRIAARMLVDQLRELGWIRVNDGGYWYVPAEAYVPLTKWLSDQIKREYEKDAQLKAEGAIEPEPVERTIALVKPGAA